MRKITKELVQEWIPVRDDNVYKGSFKQILCVGGNAQMGGAIILASSAALHAGAGLVTVATCTENRPALHSRSPECLFIDMYNEEALEHALEKCDVVLLGPGLGRDDKAQLVYEQIINHITHQQLILDADGLYWLSHLKNDFSHLPLSPILTPHLGEWQRLTNIAPPADNLSQNHQAQKKLNAYVVLKKHRTEIYGWEDIWQNTAGNPSMATGGMGDILAGIIASLISQIPEVKPALLSATFIHSYTADLLAHNYYVTLPSLIIHEIPVVMKKIIQKKREYKL